MQKKVRGSFFLLGIGCLMLLAGGIWLYQNTLLMRTGIETQGIVLQNIPRAHGYTAQIEFLAKDGNAYRFLAAGSSNPPVYQPNDQVQVFYDPLDPTHAIAHSFLSIFFGPFMLLFAGIIQCFLGRIFLNKRSPAAP